YNNGAPAERSKVGYSILSYPPQNSFLTIFQYNSDKDRQLLFLKPGQRFHFANRGNYLREGTGYLIYLTGDLLSVHKDTFHINWNQGLSFRKSIDKVWNSQHWWLRFSFLSKGIGKNFTPPFMWLTT